ncbi:hypothetical protein Sm713_16780 [Streptomyces sp. TS71-3]|nr:hypothetical protein Sm713_16780 [Streptomyces sp. TS71-3]
MPEPPRAEYETSDLGSNLTPLFASLAGWSPNLTRVEQARVAYDARERRQNPKNKRSP